MKRLVRGFVCLLGLVLAATAFAQSAYVPMSPIRVVDTRPTGTTVDGQYQASGPISAYTVFNVTIAGRAGTTVPASGVTAVAMNVTITDPTGAGNVTVYPAGTTKPAPANVNFAGGQSYSGQVIVLLGTVAPNNGQVSFYIDIGSPSATANIVADLVGYIPTGSDFTPITPVRFLDTRSGATTVDGQYAGIGAMTNGQTLALPVWNRGGVPAGTSSVLISMTGAGSAGSGIFTAWQGGALPPLGMINFTAAGQTRSNLVLVGVAADGTVSFNDGVPGGTTDLIVNVFGYFSSTPTFSKVIPARLLDTRAGSTTVDGQYAAIGQLASNGTVNFSVLGRGNVPSSGVGAVALNVVAINPAATGFLTAWPTGSPSSPPNAMQVNFGAGGTVPSLVIAKVGSNGQVSINNNSGGATDMTVSVEGWFPAVNSTPPLPPTNVTATAGSGNNSVIANWTLASNGSTPTYLQIQRATSLSGPWTSVNSNYTPATSGQLIDMVFANATYYYEVAACNAAGCSAYTVSNPGATISSIPATPTSDGPVIASAPTTDAISDAVGATAAQFRVDEGGNATYSIPIQVPPGTAGVTPKLALSYNSRLPNGVMGPGWTIQGSSQIARCRQTRESGDFAATSAPDGNASPVNFTQSDRFCLDGVRLLLLSNNANNGKSYGDNGTVYSPETDPTTLVTATASNAAIGPDSLTVQRKDGTTSTYGNTAASTNALVTASLNSQQVNVSWNLARVQDSKGNYIDYLYNSRPSGGTLAFAAGAVETTLAQINYTGYAGSATKSPSLPYASISFLYTSLPTNLLRLGYQSGVAFLQTQQLACVVVMSSLAQPSSCLDVSQNANMVRYYELAYQSSASATQLQQLIQVKECRDLSKAVCFPPTTFTWSGAVNTFQPGTKYQTQSSPNFANMAGYKVADIDGDGRQDFVWAVNENTCPNGGSSIYVGFLDRTASGEMTITTSGQGKTCAPINLKDNDRAWYLVDYDGDGRADLLIGGAGGSNWAIYSSLGRPGTQGGAVFGTTNLLSGLTNPITVPLGMNAAGVLADLNGDGLPDFITPDSAEPMNPVSGVTHQAYSGLSVRLLVRSGNSLAFSDPYPIVLTFNAGDTTCTATAQVQCSINFLNTNYRNASAIATDVNGDGRADLTFLLSATPCSPCQAATGGLPKLYFDPNLGMPNSGTGQTGGTGLTATSYYWYQFTANGISTPNGFSQLVQLMQQYVRLDTGGSQPIPTDPHKMSVVDLNGDGLADILYPDVTTPSTYHVLVNVGNGYQAPIDVTNITNSGFLQLVDINGDGKVDLVYPAGSPPFTTYNYQSLTPSASAFSGWGFMTTPGVVPGGGLYANSDWYTLIGDFDGDGAPDYLGISPSAPNDLNLYTSRAAPASRYQPRDVITRFMNGLGAKTDVAYQPLTNIGVYQRGGTNGYPALTASVDFGWGSPVFDVLAPMYVVSQASSSAPTQANANATSTVYYRYAGALMQAGGRGFLGFYDVWAFDANDSASVGNQYVATLNRYAQRYPLTGMPIATLKQVFSGAVTRGRSDLDACAANPEAAGVNCFSGVTGSGSTVGLQITWPDIQNIWVGFSYQTPICAGPGCLVTVPSANCTLGGNNSVRLTTMRTTDFTKDVFTGSATPGPVFSYVNYSQDWSFDLATGSAGNHVANSEIENWFCYDGNGSIAGVGNLVSSRTRTSDGGNPSTTAAEKIVANTYTDNVASWQLGRLTQSTVNFARPGQTTQSRSTSYTYDSASGLLTSERIQQGGSADQDLRTLYDLDAYGNRTAAYQCSANLTDTQCRNRSGVSQQQSGTTVLRYAKTSYDAIGRYTTGSSLPFYSTFSSWNEQQAVTIGKRDEFGNAVQQKSINDGSGYTLNGIQTTQWSQYGALGRSYFTADSSGHSSITTFRSCSGTNSVGCSNDLRFKFRSQTVTAGAPTSWTYYDVLGRSVLQVTRSFDGNSATNQFSGVCTFTDAHNRTTYQSEPFFLPVTADGTGAPALTSSSASPCNSASYYTSTTYDVLGRVVQIKQPDNNTINRTYTQLTTTTSSPRNAAWTWTQVTNVLGEVVSTQDPQVTGDATVGLTVTQTYDVFGDVATITRNAGNGNIVTSYAYDTLGRKISVNDPDSGTTSFTYNAAGDVISQTDQKFQTITLSYDAQGRRYKRVTSSAADGNNLTDTWTYDASPNGYGQLVSESRSATSGTATAFSRRFIFDNLGRLATRTTTIANKDYPETTAYDGYGRVKAQQDITGHYVAPTYTANGYTSTLIDSRIGTFYQLQTTTQRGQVATDQRGNTSALQSTLTYYQDTGRLNTVCSGTSCALQDLQYHFDAAGNLDARTRAVHGATTSESFTYDPINRLKRAELVTISGVTQTTRPTLILTYDQLGNICTKSPLSGGTIVYQYTGPAGCNSLGSLGSPHQAAFIGGVSYSYDADGNQTTNGNSRAISYNALNQVTQSVDNGVTVAFQYGPDGDRFQRTDSDSGVVTYTIGKSEIRVYTGSLNIRRYIGGGAIDYVRATGSNETRYAFADHLGSMDVFASPTGQILESESFDAHGNRRDPTTWQGSAPAPVSTAFGFTNQEHVDSQSFIHFNGRIYDPTLGRMLQADPLTGPGTQGLNRYAYVANNPLTLTDPSGYSWWGDILKTVVGAAIIYFAPYLAPYVGNSLLAAYAVAGFAAGVIQTGTLQGGLIGAFSAAVGYGIVQKFGTGLSWQGVLARSTEGGVVSSLEGGKFGNGFFSAGISAAFTPEISQLHNSGTQYLATALVGGTASVVSGGKFANGAESAVFQKAVSDGLDAAMQGYGQMNAKQQKLAYMATAAYGDHPWQLAGLPYVDIQGRDGFGATEFFDEDGSTVVAFRGTRPLVLADWKNDAQQLLGFYSEQYDQAQRLAKQVYNQTGGDVIFTGHSLGGGEAAAAAYWTGAEAVTFNAAGLSSRYQASMWSGPLTGPGSVTNFHIVGDPLSTFQHFFPVPGAVGMQIALPPQQLERHSVSNFWY